MNSNKKVKSERTRTPSHFNTTTTEYAFKNSATKRFSPNLSRRPNLNETVGYRPSSSFDPKFKTKLSANNEVNYETEFDLTYSDYLQAQMKKQFMERKIEERMQILEDQLLIQNEIVQRRQQNLSEIVADTKGFLTKSGIVQMVEYLQKNFTNFTNVCAENSVKVELNHCQDILNLECDNIVLKNVKTLESQEEYEKFTRALKLCLAATQKIINSGRNFKEVHNLAESMRNLIILIDTVQKSQQTVSELEKNALYDFLQNMSDFFAKKYI